MVTSEVELFFDFCPCEIVAVTGSDGKTTTTTLISKMFEAAGRKVFLGGNIGAALLPQLADVTFVMFVIAGLFKMSVGLVFGVAVLLVTLMILSRQLKKQSIMIERTFFQNLRYRDMRAEYMGEKKPEYAGRLLSRDLHLTDFEIPGESAWVGRRSHDCRRLPERGKTSRAQGRLLHLPCGHHRCPARWCK